MSTKIYKQFLAKHAQLVGHDFHLPRASEQALSYTTAFPREGHPF